MGKGAGTFLCETRRSLFLAHRVRAKSSMELRYQARWGSRPKSDVTRYHSSFFDTLRSPAAPFPIERGLAIAAGWPRELKAMSQWLDEHRELIGLVADDLRRHGVKETGRQGLPAEWRHCSNFFDHAKSRSTVIAFVPWAT